MRLESCGLLWSLVAVLLLSPSTTLAQHDFQVKLSDPSGVPLSGVALQIVSKEAVHHVTTDVGGVASIELALDPRSTRPIVRLSPHGNASTIEGRRQASEAYRELTSSFAFRRQYQPIFAENGSTIEIRAEPAIEISGHILDSDGRPLGRSRAGVVLCPGYLAMGKSDVNGRFRIVGVPQSDSTRLAFMFPSSANLVALRPLSASEAAEGGDIGIVKAPAVDANCLAAIILEDVPSDEAGEAHGSGVTAVRREDGAAFSILARGNVTVASYDSSAPARLPEGVYFLAPGLFIGTDEQMALIDAVRAGQELKGVATIGLTAGQVVETTVDVANVLNALRSLKP